MRFGRALRAVGRGTREAALTLAAIGGAACILLVILAVTGGFSLMMFKTGSMSPAIPAGSVALVQQIPAADTHVGDVVTVDRPGELPVTHRVTATAPGPTEGSRVLTLKGDANDVEDPAPYTVETVRIVRGSIPAVAHVIVALGSPWVMGGITVAAALLVVWAFWPREGGRDHPDAAGEATGAGETSPAGAVGAVAAVASGTLRRDRRT
ncbi:signal peptidase I [Streptomyces sp. MS2A]|nr:signal peptidase I [Streptomyces sp. MS2A]